MKLYGYFRSSAAYRVRIALNLKGLEVEHAFVHLAPDRLEQDKPAFRSVNPQGLLPALALDDGTVLTQSMAILEYLDDVYPDPPLLPSDPLAKAQVRALAQVIACDTHPVQNARILRYLKEPLGHDPDEIRQWAAYWIALNFEGMEALIGDDGYCWGGRVTLADLCLVPQLFNAKRFEVDMSPYPKIRKVEEVCGTLEAFARAHPLKQPDAE